ncbi:MAG: hypothetical protein WAN35_08080 [Terracidiphilus sp.]
MKKAFLIMASCVVALIFVLAVSAIAFLHYAKVNSNLKWGPESRAVKILSAEAISVNNLPEIGGGGTGANGNEIPAHFYYKVKALDNATGVNLHWKLNCNHEIKSPATMTYTPYEEDSAPRLEVRAVMSGPFRNEQEAMSAMGGSIPSEDEVLHYTGSTESGTDAFNTYVLQRIPVIGGSDFRTADPSVDTNTGRREILFTLTKEAGDRFYDYTNRNVGHSMAVVMNNQIKEVANIESAIRDSGRISGSFTQDEVTALSDLLQMNSTGNYRAENYGVLTDKGISNPQIQCRVSVDREFDFLRNLFR